ncbi:MULTISPECIES: signal recognition particle-docking protein FtsY [Proteus]|uniref:Signal recognition particle receptor FtsY n=1 Tax=Proteus columbae TaxID=1987580 RepID=A0A6I7D0G8_9GAMM|nr:signal recognition particle-docking protein FtsY [Proteus columbae]QHN09366.1 signal recognition particle-docking protein FtsY [Proteus columbae]
MAKEKKGFFSWLGFGRNKEENIEQEKEQQRLEEERLEQERLAKEAQEEAARQAQLEAEQERLEVERQEAQRVVQDRLAQEAEKQRLEQEKAQRQAEIDAEQARLEQERLAQEAEAQRLAQEEAQRQAELKAEQERLEAQRQEAARLEQERLAQEAEAQRLAQEEENERLAIAQAEAEDIESLREEVLADKVVEQEKPKKEGFFSRLKKGLLKTRQNLGSGFLSLFRGKKIDDELFEELEEQLLIADVGMETTTKIITSLTKHATHKDLKDAEALYGKLREEMGDILSKVDKPLNIEGKKPFVILMVGVNGVGKTTTIGKLARQYQAEGKSVMLAAGDTFRAAAVEQLQVWGERNNIPVVAQHTGADPASVIFDAIQSAQAKGVDVLIADTAGRLQNKSHLMEELKKIVRVMKKLDEEAPHEVMLTLDASTGQNAVSQAKLFNETVGLTGLTLTKLDGTAKGGVIFSIADQFSIPIRYIGVGEGIEDLRPFKADDFIEALFAREE